MAEIDRLPALPDVIDLLADDIEDMRVNGHTVGTQLVGRVRAIASQTRKHLAEHDRQVAKRAWDEHNGQLSNPYRADALAPTLATEAAHAATAEGQVVTLPLNRIHQIMWSISVNPQAVARAVEMVVEAAAEHGRDALAVSAEQVSAALDDPDVWEGVYDSEKGYCLAERQVPALLAALGITMTGGGEGRG